MKKWTPWPYEDCGHCGCDVEVYTDAPEGMVTEDDDARCTECGCPGIVQLQDNPRCESEDDPEHLAYINWHDEPGCTCEWCKKHFNPDGTRIEEAWK